MIGKMIIQKEVEIEMDGKKFRKYICIMINNFIKFKDGILIYLLINIYYRIYY